MRIKYTDDSFMPKCVPSEHAVQIPFKHLSNGVKLCIIEWKNKKRATIQAKGLPAVLRKCKHDKSF